MCWINLLLLLLHMGAFTPANNQTYWTFVDAERARGCHVYNWVYESCPGDLRFDMMPIPADAVEYFEHPAPMLRDFPQYLPGEQELQ